MDVLKFGGTSVGCAQNIKRVFEILKLNQNRKIVVLSAMSGVTNILVNLHRAAVIRDEAQMKQGLAEIRQKHVEAIDELFALNYKEEVSEGMEKLLETLDKLVHVPLKPSSYAETVTFGESLSTYMVSQFLKQENMPNVLLDAKTFMHIGHVENLDVSAVSELLKPILEKNKDTALFITQGFVCLDEIGDVSTLKRGGSDFSATIIGAAVDAQGVQIWTDIDGLHNNDPRFVQGTRPIEHLTYNEAAELAYFGAKILHPQTVAPVIDRNIPVWLKNTFDPSVPGTKISDEYHSRGLKAISAKDGITAIKIRSNRMLGAHGFLHKIFEVFDRHETSIDMITTSEVAISLTIDDDTHLEQIVNEISVVAQVTVEQGHSIICIVGEDLITDHESYKAFTLLNQLPVRMISYGGSNNNISFLVPTSEKVKALQYLNTELFHLQGVEEGS